MGRALFAAESLVFRRSFGFIIIPCRFITFNETTTSNMTTGIKEAVVDCSITKSDGPGCCNNNQIKTRKGRLDWWKLCFTIFTMSESHHARPGQRNPKVGCLYSVAKRLIINPSTHTLKRIAARAHDICMY